MSVVNLNNIEKSYGITEVLKGFSLDINDGERVGLIGVNGSGKTTVFKVISGMESYTEGKLAVRKGLRIGYLKQMPAFNSENTLYQELEGVFSHLVEIKERLRVLEDKIAREGKVVKNQNDSRTELDGLMSEYSELQHRFEIGGGYQYQSKIRQIASGMGFTLDELNKKVKVLSGGEKTRLGLVKLLLTEPGLLLLDEPTNHLDLSSIQWLENYLKEYQGAVILISHDRYFLDQVVTRVVEIKNGSSEVYHGNYSYYLEERKLRYERRMQAYENQQKKIKKMEEAIKRLHQWGQQGDNEKMFKRAKSMQKALDRIEKLDRPVLDGKRMRLDLSVSKRSGNEVLIVEGLTKSFGEESLLEGLDLNLYWGEKIAVIGKNGSGKTTFLKIILEKLEQDQGEFKIGANVRIGYYSQEFEGFNPEDNLVTALRRESSMSTAEARNVLAAFLFTEDEVFKKVSDLSGGEKSRLRLLQLMNGDYNFLILDEPTNHLDLPSREILEETLQSYSGTIMVVSHDRYFLNKFIDYTYELEDGRLTKYYGNYDYYRRKKEELLGESDESQSNEEVIKEPKSDYYKLKEKIRDERKKKSRLKELEEKIEELESIKVELEQEMVIPENLDDFSLLNKLKSKYEVTKKKLNELYERWEEYI